MRISPDEFERTKGSEELSKLCLVDASPIGVRENKARTLIQPSEKTEFVCSNEPAINNVNTPMLNVAFVTYNTLEGFQNGWMKRNGRSALIVQDTNGRGSLAEGKRTRTKEEVVAAIEGQWSSLESSLPKLDRLVVYVGAGGSVRAIELAAKLPQEKLTLIGCSCGLDAKEAMVQQAGLSGVDRRLCECGGHRTMVRMINVFLETGTV